MKLRALCSLLFIVFLSCTSGNEEDSVLTQQPYSTLTDSIRKFPNQAELYHKRGELLLQAKEQAWAEADFRKAWELLGSEEHAISLASLLMTKNRDSAILFIKDALQKVPRSIVLQVSLARGYQQRQAYTEALKVCDNIIVQFPNQIDALILKAELLQSINRGKEALQTLEQAYTYAPFDAELAHNLAFEYAQAKDPKALIIADSLIKMDSSKSRPEPYYFKGVYYANNGNEAQALSFFNQAIQHDYYFLDAYMDKGTLLFDNEDYSQALQTFQLAAKVSPTFADAYYWQGKVHEAIGNKQEAKENYERAYSLDKSFTAAKTAAEKL